MTLGELQYSYRGLTFGEGCEVMVQSADGFEGFEVRDSDSDQPRGDGGIRGLDYSASRLVGITLTLAELEDRDGSIYEALWSSVRSTFAPSRSVDYPLAFKRPGQPERMIRCRPVSLTRSEEYLKFNRVGQAPLVLRAADPRIYSTTVHEGVVPLYTGPSAAGTDLSIELPADFAPGARSEFVATNDGNADAYPVIQFYGPTSGTVAAVALENTTTGQVLSIDTAVAAGSILQADMDAAATAANRQLITLDGAGRYGDWRLPRVPFAIGPGSNTLKFTVTGTSTNAICRLQWRDTWLS